MVYNPLIHHRISIRLKGYDYSRPGLYFITVCAKDKQHLFGCVQNAEMVLNIFGKIANDNWAKLPDRFSSMELDVFQIMPNHMHAIILLTDLAGPTTSNAIGNIVGAYKSLVANECLEIFKQNHPGEIMGKIWQRNYYEHIIRTDAAYNNIRNYILSNPSNWKQDCFNK